MAKQKISDIYVADNLQDFISTLFTQFAESRRPYEQVWKECWWNFLGQYNPEKRLQSNEGEKGRSRIFFRLTPQKVRAAQAKIMESIGMEIPFNIVPLFDNPQTEYNMEVISSSQKDIIRNQYKKINLRDKFDTEILLMCIYGTGILKGPIISEKIVPSVEENIIKVMGVDVPMWKIPFKQYPRWKRVYRREYLKEVESVSIWDFYTDVNVDTAEESIGNIEKHLYSPYEFQSKFLNNPDYNQDNVIAAYNMAYVPEEVEKEQIVEADKFMGVQAPKDLQITVIEYWGQAPYGLLKEHLEEKELDGLDKYKDTDIVECSVVMTAINNDTDHLNNCSILRAKLNPSGQRIYKVCPFIKNPGNPYGIGVAESIMDSQKIINSLSRLLIDNKVLSGNSMFAVQKELIDTRATKNGFKVHPGKIFFTKGDVNQAIKPLIFPDITGGIDVTLDRFERWADEESGIPKYTQGEASSSFLNKTASGMSMIINQSNVFLKTTIRNIDEFWIKPITRDFNSLNEIDGSYPEAINIPMDVVPMGVDNLMAKEIKFENLIKLINLSKEVGWMPYVKKVDALNTVSDLLDVKGYVVNPVEAQQIDQQLQMQAAQQPQATLSANINSDLLNALSSTERVQLVQKLGLQGDINANNELLMKKAQDLELETQAKIMVNDRKELGKAQGKMANDILGSMVKQEEQPKVEEKTEIVEEQTNEIPE